MYRAMSTERMQPNAFARTRNKRTSLLSCAGEPLKRINVGRRWRSE